MKLNKMRLIYMLRNLLIFCFCVNPVAALSPVFYLKAGDVIDFDPFSSHRGPIGKHLRIYCSQGEAKSITGFLETIELQLDIQTDNYDQFIGRNPEEVQKDYKEHRSWFSFNLFAQKKTRLNLPPFKQQCVGIQTDQPYRVRLHKLQIDYALLTQFSISVTLFLYAGTLSQNSLFYYLTGIILGICLSFMLVIWLTSKLIPRRPMMYGVMVGGWTIGIYVIKIIWENFQLILLEHQTYVAWYVFITGVISFLFCYWMGPPKNERAKKIIKWIMQIIALVSIYFTSSFEELSIFVCILLIICCYFPRTWIHVLLLMYQRRFPPKRRFLSEEEFNEQGRIETAKALEKLRKFASSPDCNQWKIMAKLRDPLRFGQFVGGSSHLNDEEIQLFENSVDEEQFDDIDLTNEENDENISEDEDEDEAIPNNHEESYRNPNLNETVTVERNINGPNRFSSRSPLSHTRTPLQRGGSLSRVLSVQPQPRRSQNIAVRNGIRLHNTQN